MITLYVQPRQSGKTSTLLSYLANTDIKNKTIGLISVTKHHGEEILERYKLEYTNENDILKSIFLISKPEHLTNKKFDMLLVDEYFYLKNQKEFYKHLMILGHSGCKIYAWGTLNKNYNKGLINTIRRIKSKNLYFGDALYLLKELFLEHEIEDLWFNLITEPMVELIHKEIDKKKIWQEAIEKMYTFEEILDHKPIHDFIFNAIINAPIMPNIKKI